MMTATEIKKRTLESMEKHIVRMKSYKKDDENTVRWAVRTMKEDGYSDTMQNILELALDSARNEKKTLRGDLVRTELLRRELIDAYRKDGWTVIA